MVTAFTLGCWRAGELTSCRRSRQGTMYGWLSGSTLHAARSASRCLSFVVPLPFHCLSLWFRCTSGTPFLVDPLADAHRDRRSQQRGAEHCTLRTVPIWCSRNGAGPCRRRLSLGGRWQVADILIEAAAKLPAGVRIGKIPFELQLCHTSPSISCVGRFLSEDSDRSSGLFRRGRSVDRRRARQAVRDQPRGALPRDSKASASSCKTPRLISWSGVPGNAGTGAADFWGRGEGT